MGPESKLNPDREGEINRHKRCGELDEREEERDGRYQGTELSAALMMLSGTRLLRSRRISLRGRMKDGVRSSGTT